MYLITGVTGLVGSHAIEYLLSQNVPADNIIGISRRATTSALLKEYGIKLIDIDLLNKQAFNMIPDQVDMVIHAAAFVGSRPRSLVKQVNIEGTRNLAEWASKEGVSHFGHVSSVSIYGLGHKEKVKEDSPIKPDHFYGWTKWWSEQVLHEGGYNFHYVVLRPPYVTGKREVNFVTKFVTLMQNHKLPVIGSGENKLAFVHAKELTHAFLYLFSHTNKNDFYNLVGFEATFNEFFKALADGLGYSYPQKKYPYFLGYLVATISEVFQVLRGKDPSQGTSRYRVKSFFTPRVFNDEKIRSTGFKPSFDFHYTMNELIDYFKNPK